MRKSVIFILIVTMILMSAVSCTDYADKPHYETIYYKENGIEIVLKNDMQRYDAEEFDFYFTNVLGTIVVTAFKLDAEFLADNEIKSDVTAKEYVDILIKKNELDKDMIYYEENKKTGAYNFRYTYGLEDGSTDVFYYVTVLGDAGNVWYVEMSCLNSDSEMYLPRFETWKNDLRTYKA